MPRTRTSILFLHIISKTPGSASTVGICIWTLKVVGLQQNPESLEKRSVRFFPTLLVFTSLQLAAGPIDRHSGSSRPLAGQPQGDARSQLTLRDSPIDTVKKILILAAPLDEMSTNLAHNLSPPPMAKYEATRPKPAVASSSGRSGILPFLPSTPVGKAPNQTSSQPRREGGREGSYLPAWMTARSRSRWSSRAPERASCETSCPIT